jgi:hypothetical protein
LPTGCLLARPASSFSSQQTRNRTATTKQKAKNVQQVLKKEKKTQSKKKAKKQEPGKSLEDFNTPDPDSGCITG